MPAEAHGAATPPAPRPIRVRAAIPRLSASPLKVACLTALFFLQFGLVTLFATGDPVTGQQAASIAILAAFCLVPFIKRNNFGLNRLADAFPLLLFGLIELVSFLSNRMIFHYGWGNWLGHSYIMVPILAYYAFWIFSISAADMLAAIVATGVIAATIVAFDSIVHVEALDQIQRYTNPETGVRRITILKNEVVLALCILIADIYSRFRWLRFLPFYALGVGVMFFAIVFRFESRIALAAMLMAVGLFAVSRRFTSGAHYVYPLAGVVLGLPALYYALDGYIAPLLSEGVAEYIARHNVEIRLRSSEYYYAYFLRTEGLGFGLMTLDPKAGNFQSDGVPRSFAIADLGLFGALYQFGVIGLLLVAGATARMTGALFRIGRRQSHPLHDRLLMTGCVILAFVLQPIPMNFFTTNWTALLGACLWYLARRSAWEARQIAFVAGLRSFWVRKDSVRGASVRWRGLAAAKVWSRLSRRQEERSRGIR